jgi:translocation and assembly module TamA
MSPFSSLFQARIRPMRPGVAVLAAAWALPLGAQAPDPRDSEPAVTQEVEVQVELAGLEADLEDNVRAAVALFVQEGEELTPNRARTLFRRAPEEMRVALEPFGRYAPTIDAALDDTGDEWTATFDVDPGPATLLTRVDLSLAGEGASDSTFMALVDSFPLSEGDTLHHAPYDLVKSQLSRNANNRGYLDARFDTAEIRVDRTGASAEIVLHFDTGARYLFGPITVEQDVLERDYVDGYVTARQGDPFDADILRRSQVALTTGPWFGRADIKLDRSDPETGEVPVRFELSPARPQRYEAGLGYGTDTGFRGSLRAQFRRLNRKAHNAEAEIRISQIEASLAGRYNIPRPFPSTTVWGLFGNVGDVSPDWSSTTVGTVGVDRARSRGPFRETLSLAWEGSKYEAAGVEGTASLVVGQADWSWVSANDRIVPTRGHRLGLTLSGAHDAVLSSTTFATVRVEGKVIRPLGSRIRIMGRGEVGQIFTDDLEALPPTRRFITGGDQSVRGWGWESLAPAVGDTALVGGKVLAVASLETDFEVIPAWRVAAFGDAGNAAVDFGSLEWEYSVGAGIRWTSPLGMLRLDFAFPLTDPDRTLRLHLVIGPDL